MESKLLINHVELQDAKLSNPVRKSIQGRIVLDFESSGDMSYFMNSTGTVNIERLFRSMSTTIPTTIGLK